MLYLLTEHYEDLSKKSIHIISIANDADAEGHEQSISGLPWADKLGDVHGFDSHDFKNWGVASTPTLYRIDAAGVMLDWHEDVADIIAALKDAITPGA